MDLLLFPAALLLLDSGENLRLLTDIYEAYAEAMLAVASHLLENRQEAEDAVSQSFIQLHRHIDKIRRVPCNKLRPYVVSTVRNVSLTMLSRRQREHGRVAALNEAMEDTLVHPGEATEDLALAAVTAERLIEAIGRLPRDKAEVLRLSALEGMDDREMASLLGISPAGVRSRLSRARAALRELLEGEDNENEQTPADA